MKHADLIRQNIVNLEAKLDATLHFGDSMDDDRKKGGVGKTAAAVGTAGAIGAGGLYLRGVQPGMKRGIKGGPNTMKAGAAGLKSDASKAYGAAKGAATKGKSFLKGALTKAASHLSAVDIVTDLTAKVDKITNFAVVDDETPRKPKSGANGSTAGQKAILAVGAGTIAGGAAVGGLYAAGRKATMGKATGMGAVKAGANEARFHGHYYAGAAHTAAKKGMGAAKGKAEVWGGKAKAGAGRIKKGAQAGFAGAYTKIKGIASKFRK